MNKIVVTIILGLSPFLMAKEPTLATLKNIDSNSKQTFMLSNVNFTCRAYGVLGLEELLQNSKLESSCKKSIEEFYKKDPKIKYYTQKQLHPMQMYHIELREKECILFAHGEVTLSELLLHQGAALLRPAFKDKEYSGYYKTAQRDAKMQKKGVWSSEVIRNCVAELYK
jgi:hypothetical protein